MTLPRVYFISRHPGARDWARQQGLRVDAQVEHLDVSTVRPGDVVIGTLPVHLVAALCERGGRYLHLVMDLPPQMRGRELTAEQMRACGARLEEYRVQRIGEE